MVKKRSGSSIEPDRFFVGIVKKNQKHHTNRM